MAWRARLLKPVLAVAAVGTVLSGLAGYWNAYRAVRSEAPAQPTSATVAAKSLAVLPFASLDVDRKDEPLADGVSDELLNPVGSALGPRAPSALVRGTA